MRPIVRIRPRRAALLLPAAILGALLLYGCADMKPRPTPPNAARSPIDPETLKENADEALKLAQENRLDLQALTSRVKDLETQVETLSEQFASLPAGKIGAEGTALDSLRLRVAALEAHLAKSGTAGSKLSTFSPGPPDLDQATPSPAQVAGTLPEPKPAVQRKKVSAPEAALYQKAFNLFYARNYTGAIPLFEELRDKYPRGGYADNAVYWMGECQYALGNFTQAIASFRKVFSYSGTEKADDAQLKLGYCYLRLGDRKTAADEFRKVVSLYPNSEYRERAQSELAKLESSSP